MLRAVCIDGPCEGQHEEVPDPPPFARLVFFYPEVPDDFTEVAHGQPIPTLPCEEHHYRLVRVVRDRDGCQVAKYAHVAPAM